MVQSSWTRSTLRRIEGTHALKHLPRIRSLKRRGLGAYEVDKPAIMGMVEIGGIVKLMPLANMTGRTILRRVMNSIREDVEAMCIDEFSAYNVLDGFCNHQSVNYSTGEYAGDGSIHTNTVETKF